MYKKKPTLTAEDLRKALESTAKEKAEYYAQWIFDAPIIITPEENQQYVQLHSILFKMITALANRYEEFSHLMPVSPEVQKILHFAKQKPYRVGTFRPDFVYDDQHQIKIIEITCRFALNGIFITGLMNYYAESLRKEYYPDLKTESDFSGVYNHLLDIIGHASEIVILKGNDLRNASRLYTGIFEEAGINVRTVNYKSLATEVGQLEEALIVSELALEEILELDDDCVKKLCSLNLINDFRTVFLVHDKRFFSLIGNPSFQKAVLDEKEQESFNKFYVPTFQANESLESWQNAYENKDEWIIKHATLGKSQHVYAGIVMEEPAWKALFSTFDRNQLILQKWVPQKTRTGTIKEDTFKDYITGMLLFFDEHFFGPGHFRSSSFPVLNKVDARNFTTLVRKQ